MKQVHSFLIAFGLASAASLLPLTVRAQEPSPTATPSVSAPAPGAPVEEAGFRHGGRKGALGEKMAALTPEERQRLKAAHQKAMADPAVVAARADKSTDKRAFHKAMHDAMLRADPTIGDVLAKLHHGKGGKDV